MRNILVLFLVACIINGIKSQPKVITYKTTAIEIVNPERGFYVGTDVFASNYGALDLNELKKNKADGFSLFLYEVFLDSFVKSNISVTLLSAMQKDLNLLRTAGLKAIIRFAYFDSVAKLKDAQKTQLLKHIDQLKPLFINNVDIIAFVQAGFIGTWGEW